MRKLVGLVGWYTDCASVTVVVTTKLSCGSFQKFLSRSRKLFGLRLKKLNRRCRDTCTFIYKTSHVVLWSIYRSTYRTTQHTRRSRMGVLRKTDPFRTQASSKARMWHVGTSRIIVASYFYTQWIKLIVFVLPSI